VHGGWADCDRATVKRHYNRIAKFIPLFDRLLFLPPKLRRYAVEHLCLQTGDSALEIGCGTGNSLTYLSAAVGPGGRIYAIDLSPGTLQRARARCARQKTRNVELYECDAAEFIPPAPVDAVLFSLSYNTMPHHRTVLRRAWRALRPGGRLVIMDARLPSWISTKWLLPFSLWLMKYTMLGNPLIQPWNELGALCEHFALKEYLFGSYYICAATKPRVEVAASEGDAAYDEAALDPAHPIAAE
jgi:demethylmenaquinone methyltransferase/2-methoxy-6-polyprenyl-1,4-benzoquinol methylase